MPGNPGAARAKINLFLHVGDKRADGFHPVQSLAVFPELGDVLRAEAADTLSLSVEGPFASSLTGESENLVLAAAKRLPSQFIARLMFSTLHKQRISREEPMIAQIALLIRAMEC